MTWSAPLIAAEESGDRLDHDDVLSILVLLLIAGHETTANLVAVGSWPCAAGRRHWLGGRGVSLARWKPMGQAVTIWEAEPTWRRQRRLREPVGTGWRDQHEWPAPGRGLWTRARAAEPAGRRQRPSRRDGRLGRHGAKGSRAVSGLALSGRQPALGR